MSLKDLAATLKDAVGDLSSLNVETYTGTISFKVDGNKTEIDWSKMFQEAMKEDGKGTAELLMASRFEIDGDAKLFVSSSDIPAKIEQAHNNAVITGSEVRAEIIDFLWGSVDDLLT